MEQILNIITGNLFDCNRISHTKRARLLINDEIITGLKMRHSLEEMNIMSGTLIYIEILNHDNTWPTEELKAKINNEQELSDALKNIKKP